LRKAQKNASVLFKAVAEGKVKPQELKQAIEQVPGTEDKNQVLIHKILQEVGIAVKQPEVKQQQQRKPGGMSR
jgi:hypothetical protein